MASPTDNSPLDLEDLQHLYLLQTTLLAAPDERRLAEALAHGIEQLAGVQSASVCMSPTINIEPTEPRAGSQAPECANLECEYRSAEFRRIPLRTLHGHLACLCVKLDEENAFSAFESLVHNTANLAALQIENGRTRERLEALNRTLEADFKSQSARLRESHAHYRMLFDNVPVGVVLMDQNGGFVDFNESMHSQRGFTREQFAKLSIGDLYGDEAPKNPFENWSEILDSKGVIEFQVRHKTRSGGPRDFFVRARAVTIAGEKRYLGMTLDITEQLRGHEALKRAEARFRALIEKSSDIIFVLSQDHEFLFWSPGGFANLGISEPEIMGKPLRDWVHPDDCAGCQEAIVKIVERIELAAKLTFRMHSSDGAWRTLDAYCRNLLGDPSVGGFVFNCRDVTEERALQVRLNQSQKLESIGRLAGGVAHDFNNLLTVIVGGADNLLFQIQNGLPTTIEDAQQIMAAAQRGTELTRQLLTFARKHAVAPVVLDLNAVIENARKLLTRIIGEDVHLTVDLQANLWAVKCDPSQIEQVLFNLAVNARDAMPKGGDLHISTRNCVLSRPSPSDRPAPTTVPEMPLILRRDDILPFGSSFVQLTVKDTGVGMSEEVKKHIFEPFFSTKRSGVGTGLGLATVYGIVQQFRAHIDVLSVAGAGSSFEILIPKCDASPDAPPVKSVQKATGSEAIIFVEDDERVRSTAVRVLEQHGYKVYAHTNAEEVLALDPAIVNEARLLVADVVLAGINGYALAAMICDRHAHLKVLFVSGYTREAMEQRGIATANQFFLQKPFDAASLLAHVREALDSKMPPAPDTSRSTP